MHHPALKYGCERVCPKTNRCFKVCWTDRAVEPSEAFNVCDQCARGCSLKEKLEILERERRQDAIKEAKRHA
jgi:hypothetical protein